MVIQCIQSIKASSAPRGRPLAKRFGDQVADNYLAHGDRVKFGSHYLEVRETPRHTGGCLTYVLDYETKLYPTHDYRGIMVTSVDEEKREARRLQLPVILNTFADTGYDPLERPCQNW